MRDYVKFVVVSNGEYVRLSFILIIDFHFLKSTLTQIEQHFID